MQFRERPGRETSDAPRLQVLQHRIVGSGGSDRLPPWAPMRLLLPLALCAVLVAGCNSDEPKSEAPTPAAAEKALAGSPAPLAAVHDQASELLEGGPEAFEKRISELEGFPIVVNKWGSWCGPCRREFPFFQRQAIERGREVAFLGVDGIDPEGSATEFLAEYPVAFPSYVDPDEKIASAIGVAGPYPQTVFYDRKGEIAHVRAGPYSDEQELAEDIERYAR